MPNYSQIVKLENEYHQLVDEVQGLFVKRGRPSTITIILLVCLWPIGLAYLAYRIYLAAVDAKNEPQKKEKVLEIKEELDRIQEQASRLL